MNQNRQEYFQNLANKIPDDAWAVSSVEEIPQTLLRYLKEEQSKKTEASIAEMDNRFCVRFRDVVIEDEEDNTDYYIFVDTGVLPVNDDVDDEMPEGNPAVNDVEIDE